MRIVWSLRDARGRLWHDACLDRLRAWVTVQDAVAGIILDGRGPAPIRSEEPGYGYPVPREYRP